MSQHGFLPSHFLHPSRDFTHAALRLDVDRGVSKTQNNSKAAAARAAAIMCIDTQALEYNRALALETSSSGAMSDEQTECVEEFFKCLGTGTGWLIRIGPVSSDRCQTSVIVSCRTSDLHSPCHHVMSDAQSCRMHRSVMLSDAQS